VSGFKGRFYGDDSLFLLFVILTKILVRISIFETVASDKLRVVAKAKKLSKSFETLFSVDGGPLTDNVVLSSDQRVHVLKRTADLQGEIPCRSITG